MKNYNIERILEPAFKLFLMYNYIKELLSIKQTKITIELFEGIIAESNVNIVDRCLWFINPHYKQKFNLKPRRIWGILENIKYVRNFFCTSCFYIIK